MNHTPLDEGSITFPCFSPCVPEKLEHVLGALPFALPIPQDRTVAAPSIFIQNRQVWDEGGPKRVQVDVPDKFSKIKVLLAENRFIPVLEQVAVTVVFQVEGDRVAGQKAAH
jgi:hypothetical protein